MIVFKMGVLLIFILVLSAYQLGGGLSLQPNFQKGGRWVSIFRGVEYFEGSCIFYIKNKLKSEIFKNNKKKNLFLL